MSHAHFLQLCLGRFVAIEQGPPFRRFLFVLIEGHADRRDVGRSDTRYYFSHFQFLHLFSVTAMCSAVTARFGFSKILPWFRRAAARRILAVANGRGRPVERARRRGHRAVDGAAAFVFRRFVPRLSSLC